MEATEQRPMRKAIETLFDRGLCRYAVEHLAGRWDISYEQAHQRVLTTSPPRPAG